MRTVAPCSFEGRVGPIFFAHIIAAYSNKNYGQKVRESGVIIDHKNSAFVHENKNELTPCAADDGQCVFCIGDNPGAWRLAISSTAVKNPRFSVDRSRFPA